MYTAVRLQCFGKQTIRTSRVPTHCDRRTNKTGINKWHNRVTTTQVVSKGGPQKEAFNAAKKIFYQPNAKGLWLEKRAPDPHEGAKTAVVLGRAKSVSSDDFIWFSLLSSTRLFGAAWDPNAEKLSPLQEAFALNQLTTSLNLSCGKYTEGNNNPIQKFHCQDYN